MGITCLLGRTGEWQSVLSPCWRRRAPSSPGRAGLGSSCLCPSPWHREQAMGSRDRSAPLRRARPLLVDIWPQWRSRSGGLWLVCRGQWVRVERRKARHGTKLGGTSWPCCFEENKGLLWEDSLKIGQMTFLKLYLTSCVQKWVALYHNVYACCRRQYPACCAAPRGPLSGCCRLRGRFWRKGVSVWNTVVFSSWWYLTPMHWNSDLHAQRQHSEGGLKYFVSSNCSLI